MTTQFDPEKNKKIATILKEARHFLHKGKYSPNWGDERYICHAIKAVKMLQTLDYEEDVWWAARLVISDRIAPDRSLFTFLAREKPELDLHAEDWIYQSPKWIDIRDKWLDDLIAEMENAAHLEGEAKE